VRIGPGSARHCGLQPAASPAPVSIKLYRRSVRFIFTRSPHTPLPPAQKFTLYPPPCCVGSGRAEPQRRTPYLCKVADVGKNTVVPTCHGRVAPPAQIALDVIAPGESGRLRSNFLSIWPVSGRNASELAGEYKIASANRASRICPPRWRVVGMHCLLRTNLFSFCCLLVSESANSALKHWLAFAILWVRKPPAPLRHHQGANAIRLYVYCRKFIISVRNFTTYHPAPQHPAPVKWVCRNDVLFPKSR